MKKRRLHRRNGANRLKGKSEGYPIGIVAREVNLSQKTIRDYEKAGLIMPRREPTTNNRIYTEFEIEQIRQITRLIHQEGLTLPCIRRILQLAPCWNVFDCTEKERCTAYEFPHIPCYVTRKKTKTLCDGACEQCAVFINRSAKKDRILRRDRSKMN